MQDYFFNRADELTRQLSRDELITCWFSGERSDFVRFNHAKVRQPGSVEQRHLHLRLIRGNRQASTSITLAGDESDNALAQNALAELRAVATELPEDPYLLYATEIQSTETLRKASLLEPEAVVEQVVATARELDLVGIYAAGTIYRGFANSFGQRNWHEASNFNFEWSLYHRTDKAVKTGYAGSIWESAEFEQRVRQSAQQLELMQRPSLSIAPGEYRVFLVPRALDEIIGLLGWGGFSGRARATKQSPLIRMEQGATLDARVTLAENTAEGVAPQFQSDGFVKPGKVTLLAQGKLGAALVSPRTAKEYGLANNAAHAGESPQSLDMASGSLATADVLAALDTGLYVNNLWYLNFSDRTACRLTGMTRFATFWVKNGKIVAPVDVMRFDDTLYRMLGENLLDLTLERELFLDPSSYGERSTASSRLPGALVKGMKLTL